LQQAGVVPADVNVAAQTDALLDGRYLAAVR
jgi:hypothetical protein